MRSMEFLLKPGLGRKIIKTIYRKKPTYPSNKEGEDMTKLFEKVLITTDGSDMNRPAVKEGLEIARACGSTVYAIYVIDESSFTDQPAEVFTGDVYEKLRDEGEEAVDKVRQMAGEIRVETHVLSGRPAHAVTEFAARNGIDLIVVGSRGKGGFERLILGSIAESIIRMAECMVLVVKSGGTATTLS
jgi:nucleotide-binding universal stress UspA family protein